MMFLEKNITCVVGFLQVAHYFIVKKFLKKQSHLIQIILISML